MGQYYNIIILYPGTFYVFSERFILCTDIPKAGYLKQNVFSVLFFIPRQPMLRNSSV